MTHPDKVKAELYSNKDFRIGLSHAIDRKTINDVVYFGLGKESSNTVLQRSPLFRPELRTAWTAFDVKAANALLDAIGLTGRDANGLRLLPDGRYERMSGDNAQHRYPQPHPRAQP